MAWRVALAAISRTAGLANAAGAWRRAPCSSFFPATGRRPRASSAIRRRDPTARSTAWPAPPGHSPLPSGDGWDVRSGSSRHDLSHAVRAVVRRLLFPDQLRHQRQRALARCRRLQRQLRRRGAPVLLSERRRRHRQPWSTWPASAYAALPNAFKYRKTLVEGCRCRPQPWSEAELQRHRGYAQRQAGHETGRAGRNGAPERAGSRRGPHLRPAAGMALRCRRIAVALPVASRALSGSGPCDNQPAILSMASASLNVEVGQPAGRVRRQRDVHPVPHVGPLGMVVHLLGHQRDPRHEAEGGVEVLESERLLQASRPSTTRHPGNRAARPLRAAASSFCGMRLAPFWRQRIGRPRPSVSASRAGPRPCTSAAQSARACVPCSIVAPVIGGPAVMLSFPRPRHKDNGCEEKSPCAGSGIRTRAAPPTASSRATASSRSQATRSPATSAPARMHDLAAVKIEVPVIPPTFYCVGLNYAEHIREVAAKHGIKANLPEQPDVGYRAVNALIAHGEPVVIPRDATKVQYEGELVVVIGKKARHLSEAEAPSLRARLHHRQRRQRARLAEIGSHAVARQEHRHLQAHGPLDRDATSTSMRSRPSSASTARKRCAFAPTP